MVFFITVSTILFLSYFFLLIRYINAWKQIPLAEPNCIDNPVKIDVIITYRNEANNIPALARGLKDQLYPASYINYILVDDHSEDNSGALVNDLFGNKDNIIQLKLNEGEEGKKAALKKAIGFTRGELVVFTDADCIHRDLWLTAIVCFYQKYNPAMILGPVAYNKKPEILNKFCEFELSALMGITGASAYLNQPLLSNGANIAINRKSLQGLTDNFNTSFTSGDDIFLMLNVKKNTKEKIMFLKSYEGFVYTEAPAGIKDFINQRIRWASKNKGIKDKWFILNSLVVLVINTVLFSLMFSGLLRYNYFILFIVLFTLKSLIDLVFIIPVLTFFNKKDLTKYIIIFQLINLLYVPIAGFLSFFRGFEWKNRRFNR